MTREPSSSSSQSLADLPADELAAYARQLGLVVDAHMPRGELLRVIRDRRTLLLKLDRQAMLDIVVWARLPVRRSAGKESLARQIASVTRFRFDGLSDQGLKALAKLRGVSLVVNDDRSAIEKKLRSHAGIWSRIQHAKRSLVGGFISQLLESGSETGEYRFLPEDADGGSIREDIENAGVVGGIAKKLRGAADQYVHEKLDEIETRIDRKLDEIDRRLSEWRDREVSNRLRIVKITLVSAIIVAVISLGYDYVKSHDLLRDTNAVHRAAGANATDIEQTDSP